MLNLIIYMIVMAVTPGPNTLLSMANAASCGLRRGVRLNWGMLAGISIVTAVSFIASKALYAVIPSAETALKAIGAAYLVYLAVRMALKDGMGRSGEGCTFIEGMLLQLVNVKVYLLALTAISSYIMPMVAGEGVKIALSSLIPLVCFVCGLVWAAGGVVISKLFSEHMKAINMILALSLVYCAARIFI